MQGKACVKVNGELKEAGAELTDRSYWLVLSFLYMSYRGDSLTGRRTIVRSGNGIAL